MQKNKEESPEESIAPNTEVEDEETEDGYDKEHQDEVESLYRRIASRRRRV